MSDTAYRRTLHRLTAAAVPKKGPGLHHDGGGLYLQCHWKHGGRSWLFRYTMHGRTRYMGLGAFPEVSLAAAREAAGKCRRQIAAGIDPIEERRRQRTAAKLDAAKAMTFKAMAEGYIHAHKAGWKSAKHADQWQATLETYAYPVLGDLPVQEIDTALVTRALEPIWNEKPETAKRLRQRIEAVLDAATARGYRTGDNPARWRGHLDKLLPKRSRVQAVKHFAAMPYADVPAFYIELGQHDAISAKALAFLILTAVRSGEVRGSKLRDVDFAEKVWTIPAERMKSGREHRVPLSPEAVALLRGLKHLDDAEGDTLLFPSPRGLLLTDVAISKCLKVAMKRPELTVHGFRSSFRDWAAEQTNFPRELAEAALAHVLSDKTEAAYQRGDILARRRRLMDAWARFCHLGGKASGKIVALHEAG